MKNWQQVESDLIKSSAIRQAYRHLALDYELNRAIVRARLVRRWRAVTKQSVSSWVWRQARERRTGE